MDSPEIWSCTTCITEVTLPKAGLTIDFCTIRILEMNTYCCYQGRIEPPKAYAPLLLWIENYVSLVSVKWVPLYSTNYVHYITALYKPGAKSQIAQNIFRSKMKRWKGVINALPMHHTSIAVITDPIQGEEIVVWKGGGVGGSPPPLNETLPFSTAFYSPHSRSSLVTPRCW